jgi:tetratricopeptide (TPR) repeat protein
MGNILYLTDQKEKALDFYNRAYAKDPSNPRVLLSVAKASHDLEDYFRTRRIYADLKALDPDLAGQFAYLDLKGEESTRAADASGQGRRVVWEEQ